MTSLLFADDLSGLGVVITSDTILLWKCISASTSFCGWELVLANSAAVSKRFWGNQVPSGEQSQVFQRNSEG